MLKSFGPVIKTNLATPPGAEGARGGVDISKEERYVHTNVVFHVVDVVYRIWDLFIFV